VIPLRLTARRFWLWGLVLALVGLVLVAASPWRGFADFPQFWSAARTVGTPDLLDPVRHGAWQAENGIKFGFFAYPPGSAWLFAPFGAVSLVDGYWLQAAVMTSLAAAGAALGARIYGIDRRVGLVMVFAWAPTLVSVAFGQNMALALLLALATIEGLRRDDDRLAGLAVGLLLYKPTLALPLLGLMLLRGRWRGIAVAAAVGLGWYLLGVAAAGGDWAWPAAWLSGLGDYYAIDVPYNAARSISIPGLLTGYRVPAAIGWLPAVAVVGLAIPRLRRSSMIEAGAGACLVGLAVSPHSLDYEAVLMVPFLMWSLGGTRSGTAEPARTRLIVGGYLVAQLLVVSTAFVVGSSALVTLAAAGIWISGWQRAESPEESASEPGAEPEPLAGHSRWRARGRVAG
jgi:Glycosyltransferase family 87